MLVELWESHRLFARRFLPALVSLILLLPHQVFSSPGEPVAPEASCEMTHVTSTASWTFLAGLVSGEGIYTYFNPQGCGTPAYPFEMISFTFMFGGATTQASVDVVAYGLAIPGNSCGGPGAELFRATVQVQGSNTTPQQYAFVPGELCFDGPFFMGLEFHHSGLPSSGRQADHPPTAGACENYILSGGTFHDALTFGVVNYPAFWVVGQTGQCQATGACCDPFGGCAIMTQAECTALGGSYRGDDTDCDPNPCSPSFSCAMTNTTGDDSWIYQTGFVTGEGLYTYYNPQVTCGGQPYPFELGAFRFMFGGSSATQDVDIVVYNVMPGGDSCDGPGEELYRFTTSATGNSSEPSSFVFPDNQCCVSAPFFIGLEFNHSGAPGPGRETDGPTAGACMNWLKTQPDGGFHEAAVYGMTRYPAYWVYGEPGSACRAPGACCDPYGVCTISSQAACEAQGGTYGGDGTTCDPNPCGPGGNCSLTNVTVTDSWMFQGGFVSGEGIYTFFNPEADCGAPAYPYEVSAFQFMLGGSTAQVNLDIVVYDAAVSGDSCDGPGEELYRTTVQVQGSNNLPQLQTFPPGSLCVDGPFFMGIALNHSGLPGPARQADNPPAASLCENYILTGGSFIDALALGFAYYPAFWVFGTTQQCQTSCCLGRVGDANGSHEATDEITLGDIMLMVDALFISGDCTKLPCIPEADVNQDGGANPNCDDHVTLGDIMTLVDFLFITGPENATLPECL